MKIGSVFDQTSTTEFVVMLDQQYDNERLLFSYVEVSPDAGSPRADGERIIARITSLHKENPLLSRDQAGVSAAVNIGDLGFEFSRRFTYGWAKCTVIGTLATRGLDMNRRVAAPNAEVHTPSTETLRHLFFNQSPAHVPLGAIETFGEDNVAEVPVTLNGDQLVTKHFCVFGMTGSGKTNTAAKLIEELMARGHRMVLFDSSSLTAETSLGRASLLNSWMPYAPPTRGRDFCGALGFPTSGVSQNSSTTGQPSRTSPSSCSKPFRENNFPLRSGAVCAST